MMDRGEKVYCEFLCHCDKPYMYLWLNTAINGNYVIKCPYCDHLHYRVVRNGRISDVRHDHQYGNLEKICPVKSYKEPRIRGKVALFKENVSTPGA